MKPNQETLRLTYQVGDMIKPNDEDYIYQIQSIQSSSSRDSYYGISIAHGHGRGFDVRASHYCKATEEEIRHELEQAPKYFPFWVADQNDFILSNGHIFAATYERAQELFQEKLQRMRGVGDSFLSETPATFIQPLKE